MVPLAAISADNDKDMVIFDFESGNLQGWRIIEGKFDRFLSDRENFHNRYPDYPDNKYNKQGKYYLSTVEQQPGMPSNDRMTGIAESPVFTLTGPHMSMLIGGGVKPNAYAALCTLDGKEVLRGQGKINTEAMQRVEWNAPELVGKPVFLRLVDNETGGWGYVAFDDFKATGRLDMIETEKRFARIIEEEHRREVEAVLASLNLDGLRAAINDLMTFGSRYPRGKEFLSRLNSLAKEVNTLPPDKTVELGKKVDALRQEALMANPLLCEQPIVYIARVQYPYGGHHAIDTHYHTDENNTRKFLPGGALKVIHFGKGGLTKTLVEPKDGMVREPDIHFSGKKIVFSLRQNINEDFHIWEIDADPDNILESGGTNLRQLTSLKDASDIDPIYLPDDSIVFSSTRERKYNMCSRDVAANLFRMDADGANIYQITKNTLYDNHSVLMPDGRILYARWEYVDRNFGDAHGLWTVNPDGTGQAIYWSNNTASPGAVFNHRIIPDTQSFICIFGPHHNWLWGSMAIVDRRFGMDVDTQHHESIIRMWPKDHIKYVGTGGCDRFGQNSKPRYCDPYPLNDKYFLCSKETGEGVQMGLFLVDIFDNEIFLHGDGKDPVGCYNAMPLKPRERPPVIPSRRNFNKEPGVVLVLNAYEGTHMAGVKPGSIRYLRVVESPPKQSWSWGSWNGQGYQAPGMNWHSFENKRILGTVPVEKDGSAYFEVPSDKFIYFQVLDENMMMIQSMRSGTILQPGEKLSCVGCHEDRLHPPAVGKANVMAMKRPPSKLQDWYGPARLFSYVNEVQPVFDKNCVKCHDFGKDAGKQLVLAGDRNPYFNASYIELWLWNKKRIRCIGGGPAEIQQAYSWGSHPSLLSIIHRPITDEKLAGLNDREKQLHDKHKDIKLTQEEMNRVNTWLDLNGVYYPDYLTAYPDSTSGRSPLDNDQLKRLGLLTKLDFEGRLRNNGRTERPQISFERPELSPCLQELNKESPEYKEALAIIQAGAETLRNKPRCDMPGFEPCPTDTRRLVRYAWQRDVEDQFRTTIRENRKIYDTNIEPQ